MIGNRRIDIAFAVADVAFGAAGIVFFTLGRFVWPFVLPLSLFSAPFLVTIALPAFLLLVGVASLVRATFAPVTSLFVAFLATVNSLAALFSPAPPPFLDPAAPAAALAAARSAIPLAALVYFPLRGFAAFLEQRRRRIAGADATGAIDTPALSPHESYCAACGARLAGNDVECPGCGALIRGRRCPHCGLEGKESDFIDGACPRCGRGDDEV